MQMNPSLNQCYQNCGKRKFGEGHAHILCCYLSKPRPTISFKLRFISWRTDIPVLKFGLKTLEVAHAKTAYLEVCYINCHPPLLMPFTHITYVGIVGNGRHSNNCDCNISKKRRNRVINSSLCKATTSSHLMHMLLISGYTYKIVL